MLVPELSLDFCASGSDEWQWPFLAQPGLRAFVVVRCGLGIDFGVPLEIASDPVLDTFGVVGQIRRYRIVWTRGLGLQ